MPRIKSLVTSAEVDTVLRAHNCQGNKQHRLNGGEKRLKVKNRRGWDYYCLECARAIVRRDIDKLQALQKELAMH